MRHLIPVPALTACLVLAACSLQMGRGGNGTTAVPQASAQPVAQGTQVTAQPDQATAQRTDTGTSGGQVSAQQSPRAQQTGSTGGDQVSAQQVVGTGGGQAAAPAGNACFTQDHQPTCPMARIREDANKLEQAFTHLSEAASGGRYKLQDGGASPDLNRVRETVLIMFEVQGLAAEVKPFFDEFTQRYTTNAPDWSTPTNTLTSRFGEVANHVSSTYLQLQTLLEQIDEAGARSARVCLDAIALQIQHIESVNPMFRARVMGQMQGMIEVCPQYDPTDQNVVRKVAELRPQIDALATRFLEEQLAAARERGWEGNIRSVSASAPPALSNAGLRFLREHENWGRAENETRVLAVSVRGDWRVARRNIFGQPAQWGLPVHVAITNRNSHEQLAQVFELTLVTPGAQKQPQFLEYWVGNTWYIMRTAVPRSGR